MDVREREFIAAIKAPALWEPPTPGASSPYHRNPTVRTVIDEVSTREGISVNLIIGPRRWVDLVMVRHIAMYLARKYKRECVVARGFESHPTTIRHAVVKISRLRQEDRALDGKLTQYTREIFGHE